MERILKKSAQKKSNATIELLTPIRLQVKTITSDNGKDGRMRTLMVLLESTFSLKIKVFISKTIINAAHVVFGS